MVFKILNPNAKRTKKLQKWLLSLRLSPELTKADLLKMGFIEYNVNELCLKQHIQYTKDYIHVDFNIVLDTNIWDIKTFEIVNSDFGEPYFCDETSYLFIIKAISNFVMQGVLVENKNT